MSDKRGDTRLGREEGSSRDSMGWEILLGNSKSELEIAEIGNLNRNLIAYSFEREGKIILTDAPSYLLYEGQTDRRLVRPYCFFVTISMKS